MSTRISYIVKCAAILLVGVQACMSDSACGQNECCYMNGCISDQKMGCSGQRMDFYKKLQKANIVQKDELIVEALRNSSENVNECDDKGIHCIDYITEFLQENVSFDQLADSIEYQAM